MFRFHMTSYMVPVHLRTLVQRYILQPVNTTGHFYSNYSSNDNADQFTSNPSPEVNTPKEDNMISISEALEMGNSNDEPAQFTPKPNSETDVTKRNTAVSVDDVTCKHFHGDELCSPVLKWNINSSDEGSSDAVTSPSTRNRVVVFDIDDTLCFNCYSKDKEEIIRKSFPECPIIEYNRYGLHGFVDRHPYVFLPHLKILFDYLLEQGVRIVFFSAGFKGRNLKVISELLTSFWGSEKFESMKAEGQFDIFSKEHLRERTVADEAAYVKDLKVVIRDGETLLDAILVEDDYLYAAHDQKPCLYILDLSFWHVIDKDKISKNEGKEAFWRGKTHNHAVNSVYYMLGVFKTYFEDEKYKVLPLREGLSRLLPKEAWKTRFFERNSFADDMIDLGLSEVQKLVPDAMHY
ncbi:uncharacterized protein LOC135845840 [Planococcus citri]|uniref:uncharacterized protein LOC135845840 n=1 Tax=Planococcus citri TaxID=170843 RepID=UPI0031F78D9E